MRKNRVKMRKGRVERKGRFYYFSMKMIMQAMGPPYVVGPMAVCGVVRRLGGVYGKDSVEDLLGDADLSELEEAHNFLDERGFILPAQERSVQIRAEIKFCPHCGERL